MYQWSTWGGGN